MPLYLDGISGKILVNDNKLAAGPDCCCNTRYCEQCTNNEAPYKWTVVHYGRSDVKPPCPLAGISYTLYHTAVGSQGCCWTYNDANYRYILNYSNGEWWFDYYSGGGAVTCLHDRQDYYYEVPGGTHCGFDPFSCPDGGVLVAVSGYDFSVVLTPDYT